MSDTEPTVPRARSEAGEAAAAAMLGLRDAVLLGTATGIVGALFTLLFTQRLIVVLMVGLVAGAGAFASGLNGAIERFDRPTGD